jgi:hypothetical protein
MFELVTDMRSVALRRRVVVVTIAKRIGIMISPVHTIDLLCTSVT